MIKRKIKVEEINRLQTERRLPILNKNPLREKLPPTISCSHNFPQLLLLKINTIFKENYLIEIPAQNYTNKSSFKMKVNIMDR